MVQTTVQNLIMSFRNKRVLVLCCSGLFQDHLIQRLDQEFSVCGLVRHQYTDKNRTLFHRILNYKNPLKLVKHVYARIKLSSYNKNADPVIKNLFYTHNNRPQFRHQIPQIQSGDINEPAVVDFIKQQKPDLICVNGTNLLRGPILDLIDDIEFGIINLHTGLSPYSRGGNCNLYMLLEKKPKLVGITIHYIDKGIDSGDIIISSRPEFNENDNFEIIDAKCFHMGNEAMIQACHQIFNGSSKRVKQWLTGKLFLNRTGYSYQPIHRVEANRLIEKGLIADYLENRTIEDHDIRTIGEFDYRHD